MHLNGLRMAIGAATTAATAIFAMEMASTSGESAIVVGGHYSLVPPFNMVDSKIVAKCAISAQDKQHQQNEQRKHHSNYNNNYHNDDQFVTSAPIMHGITNDANESYLNGLPINQARYENLHRKGALFCRSGTWLEIGDNILPSDNQNSQENELKQKNSIRGTKHETSRYAILEFIAVAFGLVSLRGVTSQNYLCMDNRGELYAAPATNYTAECVFMEEMLENYYNLYSSCAYGTIQRPWYIALQKTGKTKRGKHTRKKQKSSHFLVLHFDSNDAGENDDDDDSSSNSGESFIRRRSNSDSIFSSYDHSATRIKPELLSNMAIYNEKQKAVAIQLTPTSETNRKFFDSRTNAVNQLFQNKIDSSINHHTVQIPQQNSNNDIQSNYNWLRYRSDTIPSNRNINRTLQQQHQQQYHNHYYTPHNYHHHLSDHSIHHNPNWSPYVHPTIKPFDNNVVISNEEKFRKDLRRKRRLLREERRRKRRREELEQLRKLAIPQTFRHS